MSILKSTKVVENPLKKLHLLWCWVCVCLCSVVCMFFPSIWVWFGHDLLFHASMFTPFSCTFYSNMRPVVARELFPIDKWSQNWPLPQIQSCSSPSLPIGELRTRLRSSELGECLPLMYDVIVAVRLGALLGSCGGPDFALAGRAAVWPSSVVSSSWHDRGKHESWGGEWPVWPKKCEHCCAISANWYGNS